MFVTYPDEHALRASAPTSTTTTPAQPPHQHDSTRAEKKNRARQHTLSDPALTSSQAQYQPTALECAHAEQGVP